jgi:hypothetical protein
MPVRCAWGIAALCVLAGPAWAGSEELCGRVEQRAGVTVLELWGTPAQAGYAHGYLLAEQFVALFDQAMLDERFGVPPEAYDALLLPIVRARFNWPEPCVVELEAMVRGVRDRVGADGIVSKKLGRPLTIDDLKAANTLADWRGVLCSSFAAWGRLTPGGGTITGRNLDYGSTPELRAGQLVVIRHAAGGRHGWMGVTWPGLIGVYTGMNDAGVTIAMHDADGRSLEQPYELTPRSLALRQVLEEAAGPDAVREAERVLEQHRVMIGNNIMVSAPHGVANPPAGVLEYDGNPHDGGATLRAPTSDEPDRLVCTNHMRARAEARPCDRYEKLVRGLAHDTDHKVPVDVAEAWRLMRSVANRTTLHTVIFEPASRTMHVHLPTLGERLVPFRMPTRVATTQPSAATGGSTAAQRAKEQP